MGLRAEAWGPRAEPAREAGVRACGLRGLEGLRARVPEGPVRPFVWGVCVGRAGAFVELGRGRVGEWGPSVSVRD